MQNYCTSYMCTYCSKGYVCVCTCAHTYLRYRVSYDSGWFLKLLDGLPEVHVDQPLYQFQLWLVQHGMDSLKATLYVQIRNYICRKRHKNTDVSMFKQVLLQTLSNMFTMKGTIIDRTFSVSLQYD